MKFQYEFTFFSFIFIFLYFVTILHLYVNNCFVNFRFVPMSCIRNI